MDLCCLIWFYKTKCSQSLPPTCSARVFLFASLKLVINGIITVSLYHSLDVCVSAVTGCHLLISQKRQSHISAWRPHKGGRTPPPTCYCFYCRAYFPCGLNAPQKGGGSAQTPGCVNKYKMRIWIWILSSTSHTKQNKNQTHSCVCSSVPHLRIFELNEEDDAFAFPPITPMINYFKINNNESVS